MDGAAYRERVHKNKRPVDIDFDPEELLYRRMSEKDFVEGEPFASALQFGATTGHSVNRGRYSEPQDVLEPDCCAGGIREGFLVVSFQVREIPEKLDTDDGRKFYFRMKHDPEETCYPHSAIWCNQQGDISANYEEPPRTIKNRFRAEIARAIMRRDPLRFQPVH